jgi:N12 class adenine-specific DNA methylase
MNTKDKNQYFGKDFEKLIYKELSGNDIILSNELSSDDIKELTRQSKIVVSFIKQLFDNIICIKYCGDNTSKENGDLIINNKTIEIKHINGSGSGTYLNTSLTIFENFGLKSHKEFDKPVRDYLTRFFGNKVYSNISPVSQKESSEFRHNNISEYEQLKKIDEKWREKYVNYIFEELSKNDNLKTVFYNSIINKTFSNKTSPDIIVCFDYSNDKVSFLTKDKFYKNSNVLTKSKLGFIINNLRIAISWQNGCGLNNPTLRAYII